MRYSRIPYVLRYAIALGTWAWIVALDIILRIMFVPIIPFAWLWAGANQTQQGAQLGVNLAEFYTRPVMRMPLLRGRRRAANQTPKTGLIEDID